METFVVCAVVVMLYTGYTITGCNIDCNKDQNRSSYHLWFGFILFGDLVYVCILQLVLPANFIETSICYSDHTVVSMHLFPHCKSNCAWLAKLPRPKAGKC